MKSNKIAHYEVLLSKEVTNEGKLLETLIGQ